MIKKELLPYVNFVERNDIETVWRIHIKKYLCWEVKILIMQIHMASKKSWKN